MILLLVLGLLGLAPFAPAQTASCVPVEGNRITAADLAAATPEFQSLPSDTPIAMAPLPGVRRTIPAGELVSLGKRYGLEITSASNSCFERRMELLDPPMVVAAMRQSLGFENARIELVELSRYPVPHGSIEFLASGLRRPALPSVRTPVEWRGNVIYGDNRRYAIWARVMISAKVTRVVAVEKLKRGTAIGVSQVRLDTSEMFPAPGDAARSLEQVAGRTTLLDLDAGAEIRLSQLTSPLDVLRGQQVEVEVHSGTARLMLVGKAESAGRAGDRIAVRNPSSNKIFQARVSGKGSAILDLGGAVGKTVVGN